MCGDAAATRVPAMDSIPLTIHLLLELDGSEVRGRAVAGEGTDRPFSGRLGLIAAVDALIDAAQAATPPVPAPEPTA
jgi:hypothetical protein